jgi:hypothetical protein
MLSFRVDPRNQRQEFPRGEAEGESLGVNRLFRRRKGRQDGKFSGRTCLFWIGQRAHKKQPEPNDRSAARKYLCGDNDSRLVPLIV